MQDSYIIAKVFIFIQGVKGWTIKSILSYQIRTYESYKLRSVSNTLDVTMPFLGSEIGYLRGVRTNLEYLVRKLPYNIIKGGTSMHTNERQHAKSIKYEVCLPRQRHTRIPTDGPYMTAILVNCYYYYIK